MRAKLSLCKCVRLRSGAFIYNNYISVAKADPFFWVQPNFGPNFQVQTGQISLQDPKRVQLGLIDLKKGLSFFPFIFLCAIVMSEKLGLGLGPPFWL